ncbi:hypothetical protein HDU96_002785 [Phlyctochytrium bullatum]|nr:hypothetical protein HDU96_002785 [Phlyctochytrium bullatum]
MSIVGAAALFNVSDMGTALTFYRDLLGLALETAQDGHTVVRAGSTRIGLNETNMPIPSVAYDESGLAAGGTLSLQVVGIHQLVSRLKANGVKFLSDIDRNSWGNMAVFQDPDGNILKLYEVMDNLENRILHTIAHTHHPLPVSDDDPDAVMDEEDFPPDEEIIEDVPELQLLAEMDAVEDSLTVSRSLFHPLPGLRTSDGTWRDQRKVPTMAEVVVPAPEMAEEPFAGIELERLPAVAAEALWRQGFTFVDGLLDPSVVAQARSRAIQMADEGLLMPAGEVRMDDDPFRDRQARDDVIAWLHPTDPLHPALTEVVGLLSAVQRDLSKVLALQGETEFQLALYRGNGGRYERHRDAFPTDDPTDTDQRRVTVICYLTESATGDGSLKLYRPLDNPDGLTVETVPGRVVVFLSGVVDHEVMPVHGVDRAAVTAWMK